MLTEEHRLKLFKLSTYKLFQKNIENYKKIFLNKLRKKSKNNSIIAVGASAKGNTFLNYMGLNSKTIFAVTDNSRFKLGKFTPGSHIRIEKDSIFKKTKNVSAIILSWNFNKMLKKKVLFYNQSVKFIR